MTHSPQPPSGSTARAFHVVSALVSGGEPLGIGQIAAASGLPNSTVHRILQSLADEGIVGYDAGTHRYSVGPELYRIATRTVSQVGPVDIVRPVLAELAERFDETVLFGQFSPATESLAFVAQAEGTHLLQYRVELGVATSLVCGASGKSVLAHLGEAVLQTTYRREAASWATEDARGPRAPLQSLDALRADLQLVRERGYALTEGEKLPAARGIGVPVFGPLGPIGSITLTCPKDRLPHGGIAQIAEALVAAGRELSRDLGAPAAPTPQTTPSGTES